MKTIVTNKKANFNYMLLDKYEAGIVLKGTEVKSISLNNFNIDDAYITIRKNEMFVINMHIKPFEQGNIFNVEPNRTRKLLMHKKQILKIQQKVKKEALTIIINKVYINNKKIKLEIALAKGKKLFDKRQDLKARTLQRQIKKSV